MDFTYRVRWYQQAFHKALIGDEYDKLIAIWHRRAGKDDVTLHGTRDLMLRRPGTYWHCLPEYAQARKALWQGVDAHTGKRRVDVAFPKEIRETTNEQEMFIRLKNGATWQLIGSDRYDSTVGAGPVGIVYSEWALANPSAYAYHLPMLEESKGKAVFITTPRGNNHAKAMFDAAVGRGWWRQRLSALDTGALTQEDLDEVLERYRSIYGKDFGLAYFNQEYLCSWAGAQIGSYFGAEMSDADAEGRIGVVPIDPSLPVHTVWDLGKAANNPVWCFQVATGKKYPLRIVDFYQPDSENIEDWAHELLKVRGYDGTAYVPHDIMATEWGSGKTRYDTLKKVGFKPRRIARVSVADGLQAGRVAIDKALFDAERCGVGPDGLKAYRREWDDQMKTFRENPVKDWAEHIGSSWRYLGLAFSEKKEALKPPAKPSEQEFKATPSGATTSEGSIQDAIDAMITRKRKQARGL